jgi:hypothetical protein
MRSDLPIFHLGGDRVKRVLGCRLQRHAAAPILADINRLATEMDIRRFIDGTEDETVRSVLTQGSKIK